MKISRDSKGMVFSTDLLLVLFLFILVLGIIANLIDSSNDKIINPLEVAELERLSGEVVDNLINNPGTPMHWEELLSFNSVRPGLAIENSDKEAIINTISFKKVKILENGWYDDLIGLKMFNNEIKSSIGLYPIDCSVNPVLIGDDISNLNTNVSNIVAVNKVVKCDFYRDLAIVSIFNGKLSENIHDDNKNNRFNNRKYCNHETLNSLNHSNTNTYRWICKEFKVTRKNFQKNNYYLLFNDEATNNGNFWVLDDVRNASNIENSINSEKIGLNHVFESVFENKSSMIFYIHFKVRENSLNNFNTVLVEIPEDLDINNLNIDYFKEQDCNFIMRSCYGSS